MYKCNVVLYNFDLDWLDCLLGNRLHHITKILHQCAPALHYIITAIHHEHITAGNITTVLRGGEAEWYLRGLPMHWIRSLIYKGPERADWEFVWQLYVCWLTIFVTKTDQFIREIRGHFVPQPYSVHFGFDFTQCNYSAIVVCQLRHAHGVIAIGILETSHIADTSTAE